MHTKMGPHLLLARGRVENESENLSYLLAPETFEGNELEYLEEEFRKNVSYQGNVSICISFLKFDADWDDYIEVEKDTVIEYKDKVKGHCDPTTNDTCLQC